METNEAKSQKPVIQGIAENFERLVKLSIYAAIFGGFFTTMLSNSRNTIPMSYAFYPQQFVILGSSILILFLLRVGFFTLLGIVLFFIGKLVYSTYKSRRFDFKKSYEEVLNFLKRRVTSNTVFWGVLVSLFVIATYDPAFLLDLTASSSSSSNQVMLIFKEDIDPSLWHLTTVPGQPRSTQAVKIVAEYTDGLVVWDAGTGAIVKVNQDMLAGIIDVRSLTSSGAMPQNIPSSTVTPTLTITPTP